MIEVFIPRSNEKVFSVRNKGGRGIIISVSDEVNEWLEDNAEKYYKEWIHGWERPFDGGRYVCLGMIFRFENIDDALFFKLTWR